MEQCLAHVQQPTTVPLPAAAQPVRIATPLRGFISATKLKPNFYWTMLAAIAVALLAFLTLRPGAKRESFEIESPGPPAATQVDDTPQEPLPADEVLDPTFDWDRTQAVLDTVNQALQQIENDVSSEAGGGKDSRP
jgi:hypothetical protein